jgi:hypothetical protein
MSAVFACRAAIAAAAHLLPGKSPAHKTELLACVAAYYVMTTASAGYSVIYIQDAFLHTQADPAQRFPAMKLKMHLPKYSTKLRLRTDSGGRCVSSQRWCTCTVQHQLCSPCTAAGNCFAISSNRL